MVAVLDADDDDADNTEEGPFIEGDDDERQMEPEEDGDDQDENE